MLHKEKHSENKNKCVKWVWTEKPIKISCGKQGFTNGTQEMARHFDSSEVIFTGLALVFDQTAQTEVISKF